MSSLTIISLIIGIFLTDKQERKLYNPSIFFPVLWTIIFWLGQIRLFALYETSEIAIECIQIGTFSFTIGAVIWSKFRKKNRIKFGNYLVGGRQFNYVFLYTIGIACILYFIPGMIKTLPALFSGRNALSAIRLNAQSAEANTGFANFLFNFIILPLSYVIEVLGIVDFWFGSRNKKLFAITILLIFVRVASDAGRTPLFNFFIYMLLGFGISQRERRKRININWKEGKKQKKKIIIYALIAFTLLVITSLSRAGSSIWRILYFYFAMPNVLLTKWIETVNTSDFTSYGLTSFNGLFYGISYFLKNLIGLSHPKMIIESFNGIIATDAKWLKINAETTKANAYVSTFWFFYTDFRMAGVVILSFLYGIYMYSLYVNAITNKTEKNLCLFFLGFQTLFFSFIRFPFAKTYYWIAFFVVRFCIYKTRKIHTYKNTMIIE